MKISRNKTKTAAIALILLMVSVTSMAYAPVQAQLAEEQPYSGPLQAGDVPDFTVATKAYLSVRPTLVGLDQLILVNIWVIPAPNVNRKFLDLNVTITKPDASQEVFTMNSYVADGTSWFEWQANQLGTWKFKYDFPGMYFPAGRYLQGDIINATTGGSVYSESVYYEPSSSEEMTITVQEDIVYSWPDLGLPTDYWTRPVPYEHREWWTIAGNWPWHGPGGHEWDAYYPNTNPYWGGHTGAAGTQPGFFGAHEGTFTPWVQAPNSPHVVWKRQYGLAGIIGGDYGVEIYDVNLFGTSSAGRFPQIILNGRAYHGYSKPGTGASSEFYWQCFDLRTGEVYWEYPAATTTTWFMGVFPIVSPVIPVAIEYFDTGVLPSGGTTGVHEHVTAVNLVYIGGDRLIKFSPWTGAITLNVSIAPVSEGTYYMNGYALSVQDLSPPPAPALPPDQRYRLINWTTQGSASTFAARVRGNITWPWSSLPATTDYNVGISAQVSKSFVGGAPDKTHIRAASLKTGTELWNITIDEWQYSGSACYADHGKIAVLTEQGYFLTYNLNDGTLAWQSERLAYPWDEPGYGAYNVLSAYGLLYRDAYTAVYAFNWTNGKIAWKYTAPAAATYETPYVDENGQTVYSTNIGGAIADGKYYFYNTEHSATVPITRGWQLHCVDAVTGEGIWKVGLPGACSKHASDIGPIADGYLTLGGSDGYMYVFGKGKSTTTIEAPSTAIELGQSVVLRGTVLDMSPAQPGTPCVSKDSMATYMEYLHKQMPIAGIWANETITGVPVSLDTVDPNGNFIHIDDITTDGYSGTFSYMWTPEIPGKYTVTATFMGDDSYGSSFAQTAVGVVEAPPPPPEYGSPEWPAYPEAPAYTAIDLAIIAAVVVAILIGIVNLWALRKRS